MFDNIMNIIWQGLGRRRRTTSVSCEEPEADASPMVIGLETDENQVESPFGITARLSESIKEKNRMESENSRLFRQLEDQKKTSRAAYESLKDTYERKLNDVRQELEKLGEENATLRTEQENLKDSNKRFRFLYLVKFRVMLGIDLHSELVSGQRVEAPRVQVTLARIET